MYISRNNVRPSYALWHSRPHAPAPSSPGRGLLRLPRHSRRPASRGKPSRFLIAMNSGCKVSDLRIKKTRFLKIKTIKSFKNKVKRNLLPPSWFFISFSFTRPSFFLTRGKGRTRREGARSASQRLPPPHPLTSHERTRVHAPPPHSTRGLTLHGAYALASASRSTCMNSSPVMVSFFSKMAAAACICASWPLMMATALS